MKYICILKKREDILTTQNQSVMSYKDVFVLREPVEPDEAPPTRSVTYCTMCFHITTTLRRRTFLLFSAGNHMEVPSLSHDI